MTKKEALIMTATAAHDFLKGFGKEFGRSNDAVLKSRAGEATRQAAGLAEVIRHLAKSD
jgi:hypothetical protein